MSARRRLSPASLLYILLAALGLFSATLMWAVPLNGDEVFYVDAARALAQEVRHMLGLPGSADVDLQHRLVQRGWFMPGLPALLSPLFIVFDSNVDTRSIRIYMIGLNLILILIIVRQLATWLGDAAAATFLIICLCVPYYACFLAAAWSELVAMHLALVFLLHVDRQYLSGKSIAPDLAAYAIAILSYIRALYPPLIALVSASWILVALDRRPWDLKALRDVARKTLIVTLMFLGLMLPWLTHVSELYGPGYLITSAGLAPLVNSAHPDYIAAAREHSPWKNNWMAIHDYIQHRAYENAVTYRQQLETDKTRFTITTGTLNSPARISNRIGHYFGIYQDDANGFIERFFLIRCKNGHCLPSHVQSALLILNQYSWYVLLLMGFVIFAIPLQAGASRSLFVPVSYKALFFLLALPPFLADTHGRYLAQFVPLIGVTVAHLIVRPPRLLAFTARPTPHGAMIIFGQLLALAMASALLYFGLIVRLMH